MELQSLMSEFDREVEGTRKLLQAVPEKDLNYKPSSVSWTMGELAQHIATIYYWYVGVFTQDVYDMATDRLERGSPRDIKATLELFEKNVAQARTAMKSATEEGLQKEWTMKVGARTVLGPMPKAIVIRSFLFSHIYHHRGEMVVYLRATGHKPPGLYGPTYEDSAAKG
ncbi:DinB family protein [Pedobacter sp. ASV28]|uniref:DinB family protein n=1 Tax=Pedobacter sp. ASV28 TaxID=2795123 RepID=UPI0018EA4F49|nr:DinB family protein [Pedobacter sp. ASV28]